MILDGFDARHFPAGDDDAVKALALTDAAPESRPTKRAIAL
ncbi:MAG TPA: hypothetical protein VKG22_03255 [Stellaceae bacterium]|nr:hypothetical protein [Stellaceae bacterium]HMD65652.1 hypothetical protein [Stellaceae bacterium]